MVKRNLENLKKDEKHMLSVFAVCVDDYLCKEKFDAKLKQLYYFVKRVSLVFTKCLFPKLIAKDLFIARFLCG